ncbi:hypothetical protein BRD00_09820 [Halobacteriales archaeon QS_8_69_26]|nr:MAG: hypothetical protein BRD00_09820 [Halobacteriales archaeon QS_8_69_26]
MFTIRMDDFMIELEEGTVKHVGTSDKSATAKLYDVESVEVDEFGDERVKVTMEDDGDNRVEVALDPEEAIEVMRGIDGLREGPVFG